MNQKWRTWLAALLLLGASREARCEYAGYIAGTYGYHENPLYNYEVQPDQLRQGYAEFNYDRRTDASHLKVGYVGGLMIFNRLAERNYYEHSVASTYSIAFRPPKTVAGHLPVEDLGPGEVKTDEAGEAVASPEDSSGSVLEFGVRAGARHDKTAFKEFNNYGNAALASYRLSLGKRFYLRAFNTLLYRRYVYLVELTNAVDVLALQAVAVLRPSVSFGLRASGGLKHYTSSLYDSVRFEQKRTYTTGKGKLGAKIKIPSTKQLLLNAASDNSVQLSMEAFVVTQWTKGSSEIGCIVRRNLGARARYLAQYANTSILSEDIYTDNFAYEGPEGQVRVVERLPYGLQSIVTLRHQRKRFGAPAVSLVGEEVAQARIDIRSSAELYLSRYCRLWHGTGMDIAVGAELIHNRSNDVYNDYYHRQISASIGIGF